MFIFSFESVFETKEELINEINNLSWQINHTWPVSLYNDIKYVKEKTDKEFIKLNKGTLKQTLDKYSKNKNA